MRDYPIKNQNLDFLLYDESGRPKTPLLTEWTVPHELVLTRGEIRWSPDKEAVTEELVVKGSAMDAFVEFISLVDLDDYKNDASAEQILDFARRWGVLELCKHAELRFHSEAHNFAGFYECSPTGRESIAMWKLIAKRYAAAYRIAAQLHEGKKPEVSDWRWVEPFPIPEATWRRFSRLSVEHQRNRFSDFLYAFVAAAGVRPVVVWDAENPSFAYHPVRLTTALTISLLQVVTLADLFLCGGCGMILIGDERGKAPKKGFRNFCKSCRESGVDVRIRNRERIERRKKATQTSGPVLSRKRRNS